MRFFTARLRLWTFPLGVEQPPPSGPGPSGGRLTGRGPGLGPREVVCTTQSVYSEEPFPGVPAANTCLARPRVWKPCVDPRAQTNAQGEVRPPAAGGLPVRKFFTGAPVRRRMFRGRAGASPQTGVPQGLRPQEQETGVARALVSGRGPGRLLWVLYSCKGQASARARASGTVPSPSRRHLRRQPPRLEPSSEGSNPNPLYHQRQDILHTVCAW